MKENKMMPRILPILLAVMLVIISFHTIQRDGSDDNEAVSALEERRDTRYSIDFENPDFAINASQYDFPIDLSKVSHLDSILQAFPINASQREYLKNHGFVNLGKSSIYGKSGYYDLVTLYKDLKEIGLAPYITTDSMLHIYHIFFDEVLKNIEEENFFDLLKNMTLDLIDTTYSQSMNVTRATINMTHVYKADSVFGPVSYTITETISLRAATLKNLAYLYVALKILEPTTIIPASVKDDVDEEMALIEANQGFSNSPIFDQSKVHDILTYIEDYSQYKPRGHYTKSEILKRYFNAMMWYGRMSFRMKSAMETVQAIMLSEALQTQTSLKWDQIYQITSFFVGRSDDLTPYDYSILTAQVFGSIGSTCSGLLDAKLIQLYIDKINELRKPRISSSFVRADMEDIVNATIGLRLMGQRLVPDSYMFQNLVFPSVGAYEGTGTPFTYSNIIGWGPGKGFPRGMEAMAVLGNEIAEDFLIKDGDVEYDRYEAQYGKLRAEFSNINESTWESNLYWGWLYALDSLNENFTASNYPTYMRNRGYLAEKLNTNLGSWTELRHDTILYAKQSYSPTCGMSYPVGYVEPIPNLYSRLKDLTSSTKKNLQDFNVISQNTADDLDAFAELLEKLQDFSERELKNVPLNASEYEFIMYFGSRLEVLLENVPEDAGDSRLVADVHTDPNTDPKDGVSGKVLEEAVGEFDLIVVIWNDTANDGNATLRASLGPIFSYYEFKQPMAERLTDEEWRLILENGTDVPEKFNWQDYPKDYADLVDESEFYDLWVSTEEIYFSKPVGVDDVMKIQSFVHNRNELDREAQVRLYLDSVDESSVMHTFDITAPGQGSSFIQYEWDVSGMEDKHYRIYVNVSTDDADDYKPQNNLAMGFVNISNVSGPDPDWDGDGVLNSLDAFSFDPAASVDSDGDGYPDEWNPGMNEDDSTTGLRLDGFPFDPLEWVDSDEDEIGDNSDAFPNDMAASMDTDEDGYPDRWNPGMNEDDSTTGLRLDGFPFDPLEWVDSDEDGVGDNSDVFPSDPLEWSDKDGDGHGDNSDEFPDNELEWIDTDRDGSGDNSDAFPLDPNEWIDTDEDEIGDNSDAFPNDMAASMDTDEDGYPDRWNQGMNEDDSTTGLKLDKYPNDPDKWDSIGAVEDKGVNIYVILIVAVLLCILLVVIVSLIVRRNTGRSGAEKLSRYWDDVVNDTIQEEDRLEDEEMKRLLKDRLDSEDISIETYHEIMSTYLGDEY